MISIVDYGSGNISAILNIYNRLGIQVSVASTPADLNAAEKIILPGVGAFDQAMRCLEQSGMKDVLNDLVIHKRTPILGVCVGMQIMAHRSEEGELRGLGWIDGEVQKFAVSEITHVPHMGWNDVVPSKCSSLFAGLEKDAVFYFLHSYYFRCSNSDNVLALTEYGSAFASAINLGHIFGVQFHPEKSHQWGIKLLKNFAGC
jgi:glutamine amidotransferase